MTLKKICLGFGALLVLAMTLMTSCKKDMINTDPNAKLEFSVDTLRFDTVFSELGSDTRILKAINPYNKPIRISHIRLENHGLSAFHLNIDGLPGNEASDIEVAANDSVYIFVEVTVNPEDPLSASPYIITNEIVFETNGNTQQVTLEAWGQNANYVPNRWSRGGFAYVSCDLGNLTWDDPRPYVIYGILLIDSCTLNIPPGARIYVHGGLARLNDTILYNDGIIFVLPNGKLSVTGTLDNPVVIQGDRTEEDFENEPGQWGGIRFSEGSKNNKMEYTTIKNSLVGVRVDSAASLSMKHVQVFNTSYDGIIGIHSAITAENCLVRNNGGNSVRLLYGGSYGFKYCTFANYGNDNASVHLSDALCLDAPFCENFYANPLYATFENCIVFGSQSDEISLFNRTGQSNYFNYTFDHCIVRVDKLTDADQYPDFFDHCISCINATGSDALFKDLNQDDYHLDTLSVAEQMAIPIPAITTDLEGNARDATMPDIGCYEYQYQ